MVAVGPAAGWGRDRIDRSVTTSPPGRRDLGQVGRSDPPRCSL